ncbi:GNAT family N-acetyltransferase, partial [bacterium]|nr:GNAT family N-acetyltransferase [bacterium]
MLRVATLADVPGIARVHVDSWLTTYPGLMPDSILANISLERRTQNMQRFI